MRHGGRHGDVISPPHIEVASCYPAAPMLECSLCSRRRKGWAPTPEMRGDMVVIDGSVIGQKGVCGLWKPRPVSPAYHELGERE